MTKEEIAALSNRDLLIGFSGLVFELGGLENQLENCGNYAVRMADALGHTDIISDVNKLAAEIMRRMDVSAPGAGR